MLKKIFTILSSVILAFLSLSFYACEEGDKFTVYFDGDGGTLSFESAEFGFEDDVVLPTAEKQGYRLAGFIYEFDGKEYPFGKEKFYYRRDITVKAVWAPENAYIIEYYLDGGAFIKGQGVYYYSESDGDVVIGSPVKQGYKFSGFKDSAEKEPIKDYVIPSGFAADKTLYAVFEKAEYEIKLELNFKTENPNKENILETVVCTYQGAAEKTLTVSYGYTLDISDAVPRSKDYEFFCWRYKDKNDRLKVLIPQGQQDATVFNEDNFVYGETVVLYVYCVPVMSEFV